MVWPLLLSIAGILVIGLAAWATYSLLTIDRKLRRETQGWSPTTAQITQATVKSGYSGKGPGFYDVTLHYSYTANSTTYNGQRSGFFITANESLGVPQLAGNNIPLRFNPDQAPSNVIFQADVRRLCKTLASRTG